MRVVLLILALVTVARADVIEPDQEACLRKSVGDRCEGGSCAMTKCSRTRPMLGSDGTQTMQTSEWDCLKCVAGAPASDDPTRLVIGGLVAVVLIAGGVVLARRRMR